MKITTASKAAKQDILKRYYSQKPKSKRADRDQKNNKSVSFSESDKEGSTKTKKNGDKPIKSYAGAVMANPIRASCSMAVAGSKRKVNPPQEQDIADPCGDHYPVMGPGVVCENRDSVEVIYEEEALLDSGASHNVTNALRHLHLIELAFAVVSLADGSAQNCRF